MAYRKCYKMILSVVSFIFTSIKAESPKNSYIFAFYLGKLYSNNLRKRVKNINIY